MECFRHDNMMIHIKASMIGEVGVKRKCKEECVDVDDSLITNPCHINMLEG